MASTADDFNTRMTTAETAIADLRTRVARLESSAGGTGGGGGTSGAPGVSSVAAGGITSSTATLSGVVEPHGLTFTWAFEYGASTAYGSVAPTSTATSVAPIADIGSTTSVLRRGSTSGPQMFLAGMNVWGIQDSITSTFGAGQYAARSAIAATLKTWGVNYVRLRLLADDYNGMTATNQAAYVQKAVDWRNALRAQGILTCFCWWDALDGAYAGASWATNYNRSFAMMNAVVSAIGADPYVFYEPFNEPNNISDANWDTAIRATIANFRTTAGYTGLLVIDGNNWAHQYDDARFSGIESYDATLTGTGRANLCFARHDYPNDYSGNTWSNATWTAATGGSARNHILLESEYGVYNTPTTAVAWGQPSSAFFASQMHTQANLAGAAPFVFGPWLDANAITTSDNSTPTTWGGYAKTSFLAAAAGTAIPAYTGTGTATGTGTGSGTSQQTVSTLVSNLAAGAVYHYRLRATSSAGTSYSPDGTFTTAAAQSTPTITFDHSFEDTATGTTNDHVQYTGASWTHCAGCAVTTPDGSYYYGYTAGDTITLRFNGARLVVYGPSDANGAPAAPVSVDGVAAGTANFATTGVPTNGVRFDTGPLGSGNADHVVVITVPATGNKVTLFDHAEVYRLTAGGTTTGAPIVTANTATSVTSNSAVLSGIVNPNGAATTWQFQIGTSTSYGGLWPISAGTVPVGAAATVSVTVNTGLSPGTTYHYRLTATNSAGTTNTADGTWTTSATGVGGGTGGRITRSGKQLILNGRQWKFAGMNWDQAVGCGNAGSQPTAAQANQYFAELNDRSLTRVWVMPGDNLANYDAVFAAAKANNQYLCITLFNSVTQCTNYAPNYSTPINSTEANWIDQVCGRHANEPTIAVYECCNEAAEGNGNIGNWYEAVAARVKQNDPQALVGTGGGNNSSNANAIAAFAAGSHIDLISYHDYYSPAGTLGPRAAAFTSASNIANKPWYMGERGFCCGGGDTGNLTTNGQRLSAEYSLYLAQANCAGYMYWDFKLVQPENVTANFGNGLWNAAKTYDNSAYSGGTSTGGGTGGGTGSFWPYGGSLNTNSEAATTTWANTMAGGRPATVCTAYTIRNGGWGSLLNAGGYPLSNFTSKSHIVVIQHSPFPTNVGATYAALVRGDYDSYWANFAAGLKARADAGFPPVINSIAWEANGTYFQWGGGGFASSFSGSQQYIDGYRRIVNAMRTVYPDVVTAWVFNGWGSTPQSNAYDIYPGDSYVTYIGGDWYNHFDGNPQTEAAFSTRANAADGPRWALAKVRAAGPDARGRAKKLIVPEWGIDANNANPGDHPDWIQWMFNVWKDANSTGHMGPEAYFNDAANGPFDIYYSHPNSRARYKALYTPA